MTGDMELTDMVCEDHPDLWWPHDDCPGPGMPMRAALSAYLRQAQAADERAADQLERAMAAEERAVALVAALREIHRTRFMELGQAGGKPFAVLNDPQLRVIEQALAEGGPDAR